MGKVSVYLQTSPFAEDRDEMVGVDPRHISKSDLRALGAPTSPIKAIRAKCMDCVGEQPSEVRKCVSTDCALWPYRMGTNVFHSRAK